MVDKWKAGYGREPKRVNVVSETAHFVTIEYNDSWNHVPYQRREKKDGSIYETWEEARTAMADKVRRELKFVEGRIARLRTRLKDIDSLPAPSARSSEGR